MSKTLKGLTIQEVLAVAIQSEEEDGRIYADLAERVGKDYPATAESLKSMRDDETGIVTGSLASIAKSLVNIFR